MAELVSRAAEVAARYHRLVLLVGPAGSGKTSVLQEVARQTGAPLVNLNLELSRRMLHLTKRQRSLELGKLLEEMLPKAKTKELVLLDNIELLFDPELKQDPFRLLQRLSRNKTVVAAWNGRLEGNRLIYALPGHPEYRRYGAGDLNVVCPSAKERPELGAGP